MISTLWRAQGTKKQLSMKSSTREAEIQCPLCIWVWSIHRLCSNLNVYKIQTEQTKPFLGPCLFNFLVVAGCGSKWTSRTKHRDFFFLLLFNFKWCFVVLRLNERPCALSLEWPNTIPLCNISHKPLLYFFFFFQQTAVKQVSLFMYTVQYLSIYFVYIWL